MPEVVAVICKFEASFRLRHSFASTCTMRHVRSSSVIALTVSSVWPRFTFASDASGAP